MYESKTNIGPSFLRDLAIYGSSLLGCRCPFNAPLSTSDQGLDFFPLAAGAEEVPVFGVFVVELVGGLAASVLAFVAV